MTRRSAFTLVELLVVVVVISIIVAAVSISSAAIAGGLALEAETRRLATLLECVGEYARHNRAWLSVWFDVREGAYRVTYADSGGGEATPPARSWARKRRLPRGTAYGRVEIGGEEIEGVGSLDVAGDGTSAGATIELVTSDGASAARIVVAPGGGLVEIDESAAPSPPPPPF